MEKLIGKYIILLPYLLAVVQIFQWRGFNYGCWLFILLSLFLLFANIGVCQRQKYNILTYSIVYVVIVWIYQLVSPPTKKVFNPYTPMFYYLFLLIAPAFWILGYKGYNLFSEINKKLILVIIVAALLCGYYKISAVGSMAAYIELGNNEDLVMFLYQVIPYLLLWVTAGYFIYKRNMQIFIVALFILVILLSTKRGPLVAMAAGFVGIVVLERKMSMKHIVWLLIFAVVAYLAMNTIFSSLWDGWLARWEVAEGQDNTSHGRSTIWKIFLNALSTQDITKTIIGNGYEVSHKLTFYKWGISIGAHNDFLDILYNFGLIGFIPFILMLISWTKYMFLAIRTNFKYTSMMIYLLACFVMGSFVSSNMTRYATVFFGVLFYYCAGLLTRELRTAHNVTNIINENNSVHTCQGREQVNTPEEH